MMLEMSSFSDNRYFNTNNMLQLQSDSSSKGNQRKWFKADEDLYVKEQFIYQNKAWKDYAVEVLSYKIWQQFPYVEGVEVLKQQACKIVDSGNISEGVYSANFCKSGESFFSFKRVLENVNKSFPLDTTIADKWYFVLDIVKDMTTLDLKNYLVVMSILDYLVGNEDRHLNNFGVLITDKGFRVSPLFDFGLGLFEHDRKYEGESLRRCIDMMQSQPFSRNNQEVIDFIKENYNLTEYLPNSLDFSKCEIPTPKAGSYIRNRCMSLGIEVKGLD